MKRFVCIVLAVMLICSAGALAWDYTVIPEFENFAAGEFVLMMQDYALNYEERVYLSVGGGFDYIEDYLMLLIQELNFTLVDAVENVDVPGDMVWYLNLPDPYSAAVMGRDSDLYSTNVSIQEYISPESGDYLVIFRMGDGIEMRHW